MEVDDETLLETIRFDDEGWPEFDTESYSVLGESDDETYDEGAEDAEFLPGLGGLLPGIGSAIGGLFGGNRQPAPRRFGPAAPPITLGPGVTGARLNTPNGAASLQLPAAVVPREEFLRVTGELRTAINKTNENVNVTQRDLGAVRQQAAAAGTAVTAVRNDLTKYKKDARALRVRDRRATRAAVAKMREEQRSQATMSMVMSMMMQNQIQDSIADHSHALTLTTSEDTNGTLDHLHTVTAGTATGIEDDNSAMMMLPMMMMGGGSGGNNDMMMMMMMMMAMGGRN